MIGFIGLGTMGKPMAKNLLDAGYDVVVYDVQQAPIDELVTAGARQVASVGEVGASCDVIEIAVWDDAGVESVVLGDGGSEGGVLGSVRPGTIVVVHSTIGIELCRKLGDAAKVRDASVVDAAMSGGEVRAANGSLAIMVGGNADDFARCRDIFEVLGEQVFHAGPLGAGMAAKLCNNLMVLANLEAVTEALGIASAAGIDTETMIELASAGTADSWALRYGFASATRCHGDPGRSRSDPHADQRSCARSQAREELDGDTEPEIAEFFLERARGRARTV